MESTTSSETSSMLATSDLADATDIILGEAVWWMQKLDELFQEELLSALMELKEKMADTYQELDGYDHD